MAASREYPDLPMVVPKSWTKGRKPGCPKLIVVHYTAGHEGPNAGEAGAAYDQRRPDGTSCHYHVDSDGVIQCVYTWDTAHTARAHGNHLGIHYELAGTKQTRAQWLDAVSDATITHAARQAARDAVKYGVPVRRLSPVEVRAAHPDFGNKPIKGFCGHVDITRAFPEDHGDHEDPGPEFPWDVFLTRVAAFMDGEDEMARDIIFNAKAGPWYHSNGMVRRELGTARAAQELSKQFGVPIKTDGVVDLSDPVTAVAWGVDITHLGGPVEIPPADVDEEKLAAALLAGGLQAGPTAEEIEQAAFDAAQRAERE